MKYFLGTKQKHVNFILLPRVTYIFSDFHFGVVYHHKNFHLIGEFTFSNPLCEEIFLLDFVHETYFILQKYNKMHLRVATPYKLISRENAKIH